MFEKVAERFRMWVSSVSTATLTILGVTLASSFAWSVDCSFVLTPSSVTAPPAGLDDSIAVAASAPDCPWSATSDVDWMQVTGDPGGMGDGLLSYHVDENPMLEARVGQLGVEGQAVTVTQSAAECDGPPGPFVLRLPADGAIEVSSDNPAEIGLEWDGAVGATGYDVYYGTDPLPPLATQVLNVGTAVTATWGARYYWAVEATNSCGSTPATAGVWQFELYPDCALGDVVNHSLAALHDPPDGSVYVSVTPSFSWQCTALTDDRMHQAAMYRVRVNDEYLGVYTTACETTETFCVSSLELAANTLWWVHVWAFDELGRIIGDTLYSSFTTGDLSTIFGDGFERGDTAGWTATLP